MGKRDLQEINAGSMADIAFLLLVFFLVTTTVEMEAGISRMLPQKNESTEPPPPPVNARNILTIEVNSQNKLRVEKMPLLIEDLQTKVLEFYSVNENGESNVDMPPFKTVTLNACNTNIAELKLKITTTTDPNALGMLEEDLGKWEKKKLVCEVMPGSLYQEIDKTAVVQLKNKPGTTYGVYIQIQDILKKVVIDLRKEKAELLGWEYSEIDFGNTASEEDQKKAEVLKTLVPERIIESKIE